MLLWIALGKEPLYWVPDHNRPRGHHEEAMLCPVLSPTLLPIKCDPVDVGSALPRHLSLGSRLFHVMRMAMVPMHG